MTFRNAPTLVVAITLLVAHACPAQVQPIDPASTQPLYQQINTPVARPTTAESRKAIQSEIDRKLAAIEREVARLRAIGEPARARADAMQQRLRDVRASQDPTRVAAGGLPELHVVGIQQGKPSGPVGRRGQRPWGPGVAVVEVQDTGGPIILAVCAYERVKWDVRLADGAKVQKVLVGGYHAQQLSGIPEGVPVEKHFHEADRRSATFFFTFGPASGNHDEALQRLRTLTKLEVCTFQGASTAKDEPFVIGPGNPEWVAQRMLKDLDPLYYEAFAFELARQRESLAGLRFRAIHFTPRPGQPAGFPGNLLPRLMDFTPRGPIEGTEHELPDQALAVAIDPADSTMYVAAQSGVLRVDPKANRPTAMPVDQDLPRMTWPRAVAFDTKRRRLLVATYGTGYLYAYDVAQQKWSVLADLENVALTALAYSAAHDCLYGLSGRGAGPMLIRYTADGEADQFIRIPQPIPHNRMMDPSQAGAQLIGVGDQLLVLTSPVDMQMRMRAQMAARAGAPAPPEPRAKCFLIDPRTGGATYAGPIETHAGGAVKLTNDDLAATWRALMSPSSSQPEVSRAMSRLASAGDQTVEFVRANLGPVAPPDPARVREWIAQLDRDDFAARDEATAELRRLGRSVEPQLRAALNGASPESAMRVNALLADLDAPAGVKASSDDLAAQLLARIGTPTAIETLSTWAAGPDGAPITVAAKRTLQEFARE